MQGKKILVVDDNAEVLRLLVHTFSQAGVQVYLATCGEEGLRQFYIHQPDLVILDVMMPDMDGWAVCTHIRQVSDVPIIFLTALEGEEDIVHGLDMGAVDYVTKPFSPQVLLARARAALRQAQRSIVSEKPATYADDSTT